MATAGGAALSPYLPMELLRRWSDAGEPSEGLSFEAVTLIVDIVDSTGLTDRYIAEGSHGAERLGGVLNEYFADAASIVQEHGGIVVRIAGDAVIALWPTDGTPGRAARSALAAGSMARDVNRGDGDFTHRLAMDIGEVTLSVFGPEAGRRFALVSGQPLHAMAPGRFRGEPGELCVAPAVLEAAGSGGGETEKAVLRSLARDFPDLAARAFVPPVVLSRVEVDEVDWMAEFRTLSVVYIGLSDLSEPEIRTSFEIVDEVARNFGVAVWDVVDEDKGVVVKIGFGLPPFATESDAISAADVAHQVERALRRAGLDARVGVATGRAFCGEVGSVQRREHIAVGPVMNYGARLMQAATGCVLMDQATARSAGSAFELSEPLSLEIKGRAAPLEARRLVGRLDPEAIDWRYEDGVFQVGRSGARDQIDARVADLVNGPVAPIIVRGEPGVGKTRMLEHAAVGGRRSGLAVIAARGSRTERRTAFHVFRQLLAGLASLGTERLGAAAVHRRVREMLTSDGPDVRLDLLDDIFPRQEAHPLNEGLLGATRQAVLEDLAIRIFYQGTKRAPCLLTIDDLQWVDAASLSLISAISQRCPRVLVVAAERLNSDGSPQIKLTDGDSTVALERLNKADTEALVCNRLAVTRLPPRLAAFVFERSGGLPLHAEQLVLSLVERGVLIPRNGRCEVLPGALSRDAAPDTLRGLITGRIDRLDPFDTITAKAASVIGARFDIHTLSSIHPSLPGPDRLGSALDRLVSAGFLEGDGDGRYAFRQSLFRETIYDLMPTTQRAPLHASIARAIEKRESEVDGASSAELAWHWEQAGEIVAAIDRRSDAAAYALRAHAVGDALDHAAQVERSSKEAKLPLTTTQRVRLERIWADAYQEAALFDDAGKHFRACAASAGLSIHTSRTSMIASLAAEALIQFWTRAGIASRSRGARALERDRLAAHIHMRLAEHAYFANEGIGLMQSALASLNHAERCGSAPERVVGYAGLAVGLSVAGFSKPARSYAERAVRLAEQTGGVHDQGLAHMMATVALFPGGNWTSTGDHARKGAADFEAVGDEFRRQTCAVLHAYAELARGNRVSARELIARVPDRNADIETASVRAWTAACRATFDLTGDEPSTDAMSDIELSLADPLSPVDRLVCLGPFAELRLLTGDRDGALRCVEEALEILKARPPASGISFVSLPRIVETCVSLDRPELGRAALKATMGFARRARVARPHAHFAAGRLAADTGAQGQARSHWRRGLIEAQAMGMPREAGLCSRALAGQDRPFDLQRSRLLVDQPSGL